MVRVLIVSSPDLIEGLSWTVPSLLTPVPSFQPDPTPAFSDKLSGRLQTASPEGGPGRYATEVLGTILERSHPPTTYAEPDSVLGYKDLNSIDSEGSVFWSCWR